MKGSKIMDNNYSHRPRKRISKETARKRQLAALCVIALIVLLIIIAIAKGCSKDSKKSKGSSNSNTNIVTTTVPPVTTVPTIVTEPITSEATTSAVQTGDFKMKKYTYALAVGETDTAWIEEYPDGTTEDDERWSSDNDKVATVDSYGHITGVGAGECYITVRSASDPTKEAQVRVMVTE